MNFFAKDSYDVIVEGFDNKTVVTLKFKTGEVFRGIAKLHEGDVYDADIGRKIANIKAWRAACSYYKKYYVERSYKLEKEMNKNIELACSYNKKMQELDNYIMKLMGELSNGEK